MRLTLPLQLQLRWFCVKVGALPSSAPVPVAVTVPFLVFFPCLGSN